MDLRRFNSLSKSYHIPDLTPPFLFFSSLPSNANGYFLVPKNDIFLFLSLVFILSRRLFLYLERFPCPLNSSDSFSFSLPSLFFSISVPDNLSESQYLLVFMTFSTFIFSFLISFFLKLFPQTLYPLPYHSRIHSYQSLSVITCQRAHAYCLHPLHSQLSLSLFQCLYSIFYLFFVCPLKFTLFP